MTPHQKLAKWIDETVTRNDDLVKKAQGNHCLTREGGWDRQFSLSELFSSQYEEKTVEAILLLLKPDVQRKPITGLEIFDENYS